jgi:putative lipoic acid-binding regulatory protein
MTEQNVSGAETAELLTFPTEFPIKVMGLSRADFAERIGAAVRELVPEFDAGTITATASRNGKYTALNVIIQAQSREQLDSIYRMLTAHPLVKVVL